LLTPLSSLGRIWAHFEHLYKLESLILWKAIFIIFFLCWVLSIAALVKALVAIDDPRDHIVNSGSYKGIFYGGGLYSFGIIDAFINRDLIKASKDVATFGSGIPNDKVEIEQELTFEKMKLIYIRDTKLYRLQVGVNFGIAWLTIGILAYVCSKLQ